MKEQLIASICARYIRSNLAAKFNIIHKDCERAAPLAKNGMLYMHVPFCHTFCPYCSFHKFAYDEQACKRYFAVLRDELRALADTGHDFATLYVGGGTTLIDEEELAKTLALAKELFSITDISAESDPTHLDRLDIFDGLITRLSCGVQSFDDEILRRTTRIKFGTGEEVAQKLEAAKKYIKTLSIDLIFNFPAQSAASIENDLDFALRINPAQITTYPLMKSNLTRAKIAAALGQSKDRELEFYRQINAHMRQNGWFANNAWSFSKERTAFNDEYCSTYHEYTGAGSGAFSFAGGKLFINAFDLREYEQHIKKRGCAHTASVEFERKDEIDYAFLSEFFSGEIDLERFNKAYDVDIIKHLGWRAKLLKSSGAAKIIDNKLISSELGRYLALVLMKEFYINMDKVRAYFKGLMEQNEQTSGA